MTVIRVQNRPTVASLCNIIMLFVALLLQCVCLSAVNVSAQLPAPAATTPSSITPPTVIVASSSCVSKPTCGDCLRTRGCAWCSQPDFGDKPRCFAAAAVATVRCDAIVNPQNEMLLVENRKLSKASRSGAGAATAGGGFAEGSSSAFEHHSATSSSSSGYSEQSDSGASASGGSKSVVQISPQRVNLKLRINEEYKLKMRYSQAEDYPIDLYYLMDLSKSMEDDKLTLETLGANLTQAMKTITSNFRLGFGSFVDKVLMPYVSTVPEKLREPCPNCSAPYGFRNHLRLNNNSQLFTEEVKNSKVSGNLDAPEGGFDAIMQAIVCHEEIGWRHGVRRLLLFSTDAGFHYAGDGKLGGVITPNDGACHLSSDGMYEYSSVQDYPSISHINQKVKEHSVNIIFAVTGNQQSVYQKLSEHVEGSSCAQLNENSSNVVQLVRDEYNKISSSIEMKSNASSAIKITYFSSCLSGGKPIETNKCDNLRVGDVVTFSVNIAVTACPAKRRDWHQVVQIYPVGLSESMIVDVELLCDCECERSAPAAPAAAECSGSGLLKCGICECDELHSGKACECSITELHSDPMTNSSAGCRRDNATNIDCSGRGTCLCGQCECIKRDNTAELVQGRFCECDNFSCDRSGGRLCSGSEHGQCECGECVCQPGWTGNACDCRDTVESCVPPGGAELCSGHGRCECGACSCNANDEGRFSGRYCENCPTCQGRCAELRDCVQCMMYEMGPLAEAGAAECATNCTFVPVGVERPDVERAHEHLCTFYDEQDCKFTFVYADETNEEPVRVRAQEVRDCPRPVFVLGIVFGVIAAIVLIGLAMLLLWKLLTTIHDRREFAKFEKERSMAKWDTGENPIYKQATTTFKNPTYAGK